MWRAVLRAVVLVCALLLQCPVADTSVLTASTADSDNNAAQECVDRKHSDGRTCKNVFGKACEWYALGATRCDDYGKGFITEFTALEACCVCGGGVQGCVDRKHSDGRTWRDSVGDGCGWYSGDRCLEYGNTFRNEFTANEACCVCGGVSGDAPLDDTPQDESPTPSPDTAVPVPSSRAPPDTSAPPTPSPTLDCADRTLSAGGVWSDSDGDGCSWYTQQGCAEYGSRFRNEFVANEACCVCGGGLSSTPQCADVSLSNGDPWRDSTGDPCRWYTPTLCTNYGTSYRTEGVPTANEACCGCGGGTWTGIPTEVRLWGQVSLSGTCHDFTQSMRDRFVAVVQTLLKAHVRVDIACGSHVHYVVHALIPWNASRAHWWAPRLEEALLIDPVLRRLTSHRSFLSDTPCEATGALSAVERDGRCDAMLCEPHLTLALRSVRLVCDTEPRGTGSTSSSGFSEADVAAIIVGCMIGMIILAAVAFCLLRPRTAHPHPRGMHRAHARNESTAE